MFTSCRNGEALLHRTAHCCIPHPHERNALLVFGGFGLVRHTTEQLELDFKNDVVQIDTRKCAAAPGIGPACPSEGWALHDSSALPHVSLCQFCTVACESGSLSPASNREFLAFSVARGSQA